MGAEKVLKLGEIWNRIAAGLPGAHILQTWEWSRVKAEYGWEPIPLVWQRSSENNYECLAGQDGLRAFEAGREPAAAVMLLQRQIPLRGLSSKLRVMYASKGPMLDWADGVLRKQVLNDLGELARKQGAIFVKIDPDLRLGRGIPGEPDASENEVGQAVVGELKANGWQFSQDQIQFRNTVQIDLSPDEDTLLANMKQKTRYNVRLAGRRGVNVRSGGSEDLELLYRMYAETSVRDGFVIRGEKYYYEMWRTFLENDGRNSACASTPTVEPLIAEVAGEAVAAVVIFRFAGKAWYLHGMSRDLHREKMPNYLLQWEAMRRAKAAGCETYDLWGAPDVFDEEDAMWGVYRFKEGLGGRVVRHVGAWDLPVRPMLYRLYTQTLPRLLSLMRRRGLEATRQSVG